MNDEAKKYGEVLGDGDSLTWLASLVARNFGAGGNRLKSKVFATMATVLKFVTG
ncbi:hypothetical protein O9929_00535 [Vibrio lentus]|nr:hypothetical protein [Vibrio lentus]